MANITAKGEEKRNEIIAISDDLFRKHGYEHTTLRMIAGKVGISTGHLVHYFSEKKQIMYALSDLLISNIWDNTETIDKKWDEDPFIMYSFAVHWHFLICAQLEDIQIIMKEFCRDGENQIDFSQRFADRFISILEKRGYAADMGEIRTYICMAFAAQVCYINMDKSDFDEKTAAETSDSHVLMLYSLLGKPRKSAERANSLVNQKIKKLNAERLVKPFSFTYRDYVLEGKEFIV